MSIKRFSTGSISSPTPKNSKLWDQETFPGTFESIATANGDNASYLSFSNIPQNYRHLQLRVTARDNVAALTQDPLYLKINNDTGNNYTYHSLLGDGSSASATNTVGGGLIVVGKCPGGSSTANMFGVAIIDILDYTNTNKYKTVRSISGNDQNGSGQVGLFSGVWLNTAAITRLDFGVANYYDSFYTQWALYGIRG